MTWAEFYVLWCGGGGGGHRAGGHDPDRLREQINRRRAAKGLPPMREPTPGELKAAQEQRNRQLVGHKVVSD